MNKFVALLLLCGIAYTVAAPASAVRNLPALNHEEIHDDFGQYALRYVTAEGIMVSERGQLVPTADGKDHVLTVEGEVSYIGEDGKSYVTKYKAGLNGFEVEGDHLPVAPEPEPVQA